MHEERLDFCVGDGPLTHHGTVEVQVQAHEVDVCHVSGLRTSDRNTCVLSLRSC